MLPRRTWFLALSLAFACSDSGTGEGKKPAFQAATGGVAASSGGAASGGIAASSGGAPVTAAGGPSVVISTGGSGPPPDVANGTCEQLEFESKRTLVEVLLVLDRSASMDEHDIEDGVTRWEGVVPVVNRAVTDTDAAVAWGLKTFPEQKDNECEQSSVTSAIDVPIAPANATRVVEAINQTTPDGDGTPTAAALNAAVTYLSGRATDDEQFILLATDGQPSCSVNWDQDGDDARGDAEAAARAAFAAGFPVFVVGVLDDDPSDSTVETLNAMAVAGGKPRAAANSEYRFHLASSQAELIASLTEITGEVASCKFSFASPPPDPDNIAVKLDGEKLMRDPGHASGWDYTGPDQLGIELYGSACDKIEAADQSGVQVIFGCPGRPLT
jgi:hypothetical protein